MAQSLASSGTSAQIITLPTAALQPVPQQRGPGRRPSSVINFGRYKCDHVIAAKAKAQEAALAALPQWRYAKADELDRTIVRLELALANARSQLVAVLKTPFVSIL